MVIKQVSTLLRKNWFVLLLLAVLITVTYLNSLRNQFVTDDLGLVKEGKNLINLGYIFGEPSVIFRRVVYALIYLTTGLQPWALRLTNILFHLGSSFLAYLVVKKLINHQVAILTASIFAVHPLLSETVVWISAGGYAQYTFFFLLSFWLFVSNRTKTRYILSLVFYVLALLSLNRALVLGTLFPLYELCFPEKNGGLKKTWKRWLPFLIISGVWLVTFLPALGTRATSLEQIYYKDGYLYNPLIQWPLAIGSYLSLLVWPQHLTYVHTNTQTTLVYIFRLLILLGFFGSLIYSWLKNRVVFFGLSLFLLSLMPSLTPLKIAFIVAERYVYLGSLGIIMIISYFYWQFWKIKEVKIILTILLGLVLIGFMIRTMVRNTDWKDDNTLWQKTSEVSLDSSQAHLNLGVKYGKARDYTKAEQEFITAIEINPKIAQYYFNLGVLYLKTGKKVEAKTNFQKALELKPDYPDAQKGLEVSSK